MQHVTIYSLTIKDFVWINTSVHNYTGLNIREEVIRSN